MIDAVRLAELIELGRALRPTRLNLTPLLALGRELLADRDRGLTHFVDRVYTKSDEFRERWMGQTALRFHRLSEARRREIRIIGASTDLLGPSGRRYDERLHTATIAWAMSHAVPFRETAIRAFVTAVKAGVLRGAASPLDDSALDVSSVTTIPERSVGGFGRVDVWLETQSHVIAVEAKLLAAEGNDQIPRYNQARGLLPPKDHWTVVFLTVTADQEPTGDAIQITFADLLRAWLPVAASGDSTEHQHFGLYLASVARICGIGQPGTFDDWNFSERRAALDLILGTP
jgi:hypothetical protein